MNKVITRCKDKPFLNNMQEKNKKNIFSVKYPCTHGYAGYCLSPYANQFAPVDKQQPAALWASLYRKAKTLKTNVRYYPI